MSDHEWCRDVRRDEAIRAAEDAAAVPSIQHRDLPEQVALLWASVGDLIGRVVRLEGEMDAGQNDSASPAEGLRTERVTLEVTHRKHTAHEWAWPQMIWLDEIRGESVRVVDEADAASDEPVAHGATLSALAEVRESLAAANRGIARLTAERDAAIRGRDEANEECERRLTMCESMKRERDAAQFNVSCLKARVAELESAAKAGPAANAGGVSNPGDVSGDGKSNCQGTLDGSQEPVAWGVRRSDGTWWRDCRATRGEMLSVVTGGGDANNVVSPLYAGPSRGWLTAEERDLIAGLTDDDVVTEEGQNIAKALLARETPPRVKGPTGWAYDAHDMAWIAAIRAAGGEVE